MLKFRNMTQWVTTLRHTDVPLEEKIISAATWKVLGQAAESQGEVGRPYGEVISANQSIGIILVGSELHVACQAMS